MIDYSLERVNFRNDFVNGGIVLVISGTGCLKAFSRAWKSNGFDDVPDSLDINSNIEQMRLSNKRPIGT